MRKISIFLDKEQIKENTEFEALEYSENLEEFIIQLDYQLVNIHLGPGKITIDKKQFEEQLAHYNQQCIEQTARYHFMKLHEIAEKGDPKQMSIAKASLRALCENYIKNKSD